MEQIEFGNDGLIDLLTRSMAPSLFYENLKREVAQASRDGRELAVLSIALRPESQPSLTQLQEELIALAFILRTGLRGGDFFGRISEYGFWVCLRGNASEIAVVQERLGLTDRLDLVLATILRDGENNESSDEWIARIDRKHF